MGDHQNDAFEKNTHNANVLWEEVKNEVEGVFNTAYGTDPRHTLAARAVADKIAFGTPVPWSLRKHFGR